MRLLIALPDRETAAAIQTEMEWENWNADVLSNGTQALRALLSEEYDIALLHLCLAGLDGRAVGNALAAADLLCPPRILFVCPPECCLQRPFWADCTVPAGVGCRELSALVHIIAQKPLSRLAAAQRNSAAPAAAQFLDAIGLSSCFKGRVYASWLLEGLIVSPALEKRSMNELYQACAAHFGVTQGSVERCLRVAVENVFTQGSLHSIEQFFGATIDPERGKPTNRAFLLQAAQRLRTLLRHSRTAARSPNSSEMHHRPAAPTSV